MNRPVIDPASGLLESARQVASPNCDERPAGCAIDLVIIHAISLPPGEFGGPWVESLFCGRLEADAHPYFRDIHALRVSAHLLIRRDGELVQFVPLHLRAWHAGASRHQGRENCNDFSIGIELEGCDNAPFEDAQYQRLVEVLRSLCAAYPALNGARIVGHSDVAPGRKTDPGPHFDWNRVRAALRT